MKKTRFAPRGESRVGGFHWANDMMIRNEHLKRILLGGLR